MARWNTANVLQSQPGGRRLWRFTSKGDHFVFEEEKTLTLLERAPFSMVGKDWQSLISPRLNVAWLPVEKVFFRAVHLPSAELSELKAMVELQLEKISPLPVTHIVWNMYLMPRPEDKPDALQTVIVVIALRHYLEELIGELQAQGFQPDRVEAPALDQVLAAKMNGDGVWIFPGAEHEPALVVWHYGGAIQSINQIPLQAGAQREALLKAHIEQVAWAGELEGWLTGPPRLYLVAAKPEANAWMALLKPLAENGLDIVPPLGPAELAAQNAQRTGREGTSTNLLPEEFTTRYHQQLVDRLWLRGLMSALVIYMFGVLVYFGMVYGLKRQLNNAQDQLAKLGPAYTNSLNDNLQVGVLKETQRLKYAALDCWKAVALNLPESMTLDSMYFNGGKLTLSGTADTTDPTDVAIFNENMRRVQTADNAGPLFSDVGPPRERIANGRTSWGFECALQNNPEQ